MNANTVSPAYAKIFYRTATVNGLDIFYREAGSSQNPTVLLLHGFPTSSHMFRELIPALAEDFHVIAPDYPGFGQSSAPDADSFHYTFDHLGEVIEKFLQQIGCTRFALFMQDYGAPVGFRIASKHPEWITALLVQNANAYLEGINLAAFAPVQPFWANRTPETEAPVRGLLTMQTTMFQYTHGVRNPAAISPDTWVHDQSLLDRPGNDLIQLALLHDYRNNPPRYAEWQAPATASAGDAYHLGQERSVLHQGRCPRLFDGCAGCRTSPAGHRPLRAGRRWPAHRQLDPKVSAQPRLNYG